MEVIKARSPESQKVRGPADPGWLSGNMGVSLPFAAPPLLWEGKVSALLGPVGRNSAQQGEWKRLRVYTGVCPNTGK